MLENKNTILAIALSALVLIGWQYFVGMPQEKARQEQLQQQQLKQGAQQPVQNAGQPGQPSQPTPSGGPAPVPGAAAQSAAPATVARADALNASPRVKIETGAMQGSISLRGARLDDIALTKFRETIDPKSPAITLLSPTGTADPLYAEFGWTNAAGATAKLPDGNTVWKQDGTGTLTTTTPVTLSWDNGGGLVFRRTFSVDDKYVFSVKDDVENRTAAPVTLYPFGLISRHNTPHTLGYYILHEGPVGILGSNGLQEKNYKDLDEKKTFAFDNTKGWLGFTDKYWAAVLLPDPQANLLKARFTGTDATGIKIYQADYLLDPQTVAPGATGTASGRVFAGAKEVAVIDGYDKALNLDRFDRVIDWGWFYFITKPLFMVIDFLYHLVGNFGLAILLVTVMIKICFFPLANKSYASMAKMKAVQPQMAALRERYPDDKVKQQQELMELYKKEKINPIAGCLPIAVQIPVFFSLYKVLFITIEMRHAPFFGWIHDLSAPDPTNIFTLFGLIPWDPTTLPVIGSFLHLGLWGIIMGITMWAQMKLNPAPPDPAQKMIFDWMPVIFTFMLSSFPAGLVIYWAWNNTLSVAQQSYIMSKHGTKIELIDNVKSLFVRKKKA